MNILLIEDDKHTATYVANGLREHGHAVDQSACGRDGLSRASDGAYDLMIVDRMLPGIDGLSIVKNIRGAGIKTPVLLARLNALSRRPPIVDDTTVLRTGDLELNRLKRTVTRGGKRIDLQPQEFRLLEYLMNNAGQVVTRTMLLENVWEFHFDPRTSVVETHISRLRAKIDRDFDDELLHTVRGSGYSLGVAG